MIAFFAAIAVLSMLAWGAVIFIRTRVVTNYRGALLILLSGVYFALFFYIAHLMRENFR